MSRRLATSVTITDSNGMVTTFRSGDTPPDDVADLILNPDCWAPEEGPVPVAVPVVGLPPDAPRVSVPVVVPGTTPHLLTPTGPAPGEGEDAPPPTNPGDPGVADPLSDGEHPDDDGAGATPNADGEVPQPARNGATAAWRARAVFLGQEVPEDAGREQIIDQLETNGLIEK